MTLAVVVAVVVAYAIANTDRYLNTDAAEDGIVRATQEHTGVAPTDVQCPEKVKVWPGSKFICTGSFNGQPYWWEVEQQDATGRVLITPKDAQ